MEGNVPPPPIFEEPEPVNIVKKYRKPRKQIIEEQQKRAQKKARETSTGVLTFLLVAEWAVHLATNIEPDPEVRRARRELMVRKWRRYSLDLANMAYS